MSNSNTSAVKSVKVISDARAEDILIIMRQLHGKVLLALQECDIKPGFNDNFDKSTTEDYKNLHHQTRILLSAHSAAKWEKRIAGIRSAMASTLAPFITKRDKAYKAFMALDSEDRDGQTFNFNVNVPMAAVVGCWPQGTSDSVVFKDLTDMGYNVFRAKDNTYTIKVPYTPAPEKEEVVADPDLAAAAE